MYIKLICNRTNFDIMTKNLTVDKRLVLSTFQTIEAWTMQTTWEKEFRYIGLH